MSEATAWPAWDRGDLRSLARYVVPDALARGDLATSIRYDGTGRVEDRVRGLYDHLTTHTIPYSLEPWTLEADRQYVRSPEQIKYGSATCLDLAVSFAAMCRQADLRAFVAIVDGRHGSHALVAVESAHGIHDASDPSALGGLQRVGQGTYGLGRRPGRELLVLDVVSAARQYGKRPGSFEKAADTGARWLDTADSVTFVDTITAGVAQLPVPNIEHAPVIHSRLPAPGEAFPAPSRRRVADQIAKTSGYVVLWGDSGAGKTTLALGRAHGAEFGYGWVLTASDKDTMIAQLAAAERREISDPARTVGMKNSDLASAALHRLHSTRVPWVVVLDNANCPPAELRSWLPAPRDGQTVVVTTTEPSWACASWTSQPVTSHEILPVGPDELHALGITSLGDELDTLVGGNLVLARCALQLSRAGVTPVTHAGRADGPDVLLDAALDRAGPEARALAHLFAWSPTGNHRTAGMIAALSSGPEALAELERLGVVVSVARDTSGAVREATMHNLLRASARQRRDDLDDRRPALRALLGNEELRRTFQERADKTLVDDLRAVVEHDRPGADAWAWLGRVLEYRGDVTGSAAASQKALEHADELSPELAADSLLCALRPLNQGAFLAAEVADGAARIVGQTYTDQIGDPVVRTLMFERLRSLRLLLERKLVKLDGSLTRAAKRARLIELYDDLKDSRDRRADVVTTRGLEVDDIDRGTFNICGTALGIGQTGETDRDVVAWYDEATEQYGIVLAMREARYRGAKSEHVAACHNGLGVVSFYRALHRLRSGADSFGDAVDLLREAREHVTRGLEIREAVAGAADGSDVFKSLDLLAKIDTVRRYIRRADDPTTRSHAALIAEADDELAQYARLQVVDTGLVRAP